MKTCNTCNETKELTEFHKESNNKDGLRNQCKECRKIYMRNRRLRDIEKFRAKDKQWRKKYAAKRKAYMDKYRKENEAKFVYYTSIRRRLMTVDQRCECCTNKALNEFYRMRPEGHHVDHIQPLSKGGMHCLSNLQYLTAAENLSKGDKVTK